MLRFAAALVIAFAVSVSARADEPFSHGVLFRLDRAGADTSWVFGTIHSTDRRALALPPAVARAFARARTFAPEIELSDVDAADFFAMAHFDDERRLSDFFDADSIAAIRRALGGDAPADATFARLKPWAVLLKLAQAPVDATAAGTTLDASLLIAARARRMSILGLELPAEQASALDSIPLASQVALVRYLLERRDALARDNAAALDAWLDRDLARLTALSDARSRADPAIAPHFAALRRHVIDDRSVLMAHRLFLPLRHGGVFVAVGALHLYGAHGLLALLRDQGYRIRRLH